MAALSLFGLLSRSTSLRAPNPAWARRCSVHGWESEGRLSKVECREGNGGVSLPLDSIPVSGNMLGAWCWVVVHARWAGPSTCWGSPEL